MPENNYFAMSPASSSAPVQKPGQRLSWAKFFDTVSKLGRSKAPPQSDHKNVQVSEAPQSKRIDYLDEKTRAENAEHNLTRSPLLLLPRELRDMIYACLCEAPPNNTAAFQPICNGSTRISQYGMCGDLFYEDKYPKYNLLGLIHTSSLLRTEALEIFNRLKDSNSSASSYKLELIAPCVTWNVCYLPTWSHMVLPPPFYDRLEGLDVELRLLSLSDYIRGFHGCGGVPPAYFGLFRLLNDFFHHGPQLYYDADIVGFKMPYIEKLNLNVTMWKLSQRNDEDLVQLPFGERIYQRLEGDPNRRVVVSIGGWLWMIAHIGYLGGKVGAIHLYGDSDQPYEYSIADLQSTEVKPDQTWEASGFQWGPKPHARRSAVCKCGRPSINDRELTMLIDFVDGGHIEAGRYDEPACIKNIR